MNQETIQFEIPWPQPKFDGALRSGLGVNPTSSEGLALVSLAHAIQAPETLRGIKQAADAFGSVLPRLNRFSIIELAQIEEWQSALKVLHNIQDIPEHFKRASYRGYCKSNPLYAVLLDSDSFKSPRQVSEHLMACFYLAFLRDYDRLGTASRARAGLSLRSTLNGRGFSSTQIFRLFCRDIALSTDLDELEQSLKPSRSIATGIHPTAIRYIRFLRLFILGRVHKGNRWNSGHSGRPRYRLPDLPDTPYFPASPQFDPDDEDTQPDDPGRLINLRHVDETNHNAPTEGAALTDAAESSETISEFSRGISLEVAADRLRMRWRAEHVSHAIAANNRFLPTQWHQLNRFDLYVFTKELIQLSRSSDQTVENVPAPLLAGLLASIFCRGTDMQTAIQMRQIDWHSDTANNHFRLFPENGQWHGKWFIDGNLFHHFARLPMDVQARVLNPDTHFQVVLSMPAWCAEILARAKQREKELVCNSNMDSGDGQGSLFFLSLDVWKQAASSWLAKVRESYPACRLTIKRLELFLSQTLVQILDVDMAEGAYVHGSLHPIYETQLYYTAIPVERIQDIYQRIWIKVGHHIADECAAWNEPNHLIQSVRQMSIPRTEQTSRYIGSRITPTDGAVEKLRIFLQEHLNEARSILPRYRRTIEFHNRFALYTAFLLAYCTGYRAVQDPLPDPNLIDPVTGCCLISDKDQTDSYCTRIVWLPDIAIQQIHFYKAHLERIATRLCLIKNESFQRLRETWTGWQESQDREPNCETMVPFLFRFDNHANPKSITPSWLRQMTKDAFPLPINANRHYLRTGLCQLGCPKDVIDAFMGHWHRGREPWGKHSSLSPATYSRMLHRYLIPLVQRAGWQAIQSIEG